MQQWEHQYVVFSNLDSTEAGGFGVAPQFTVNGVHQSYSPDLNIYLTQVGNDGWELVGMHVADKARHFAFKRPKQTDDSTTATPGLAQNVLNRVATVRDAVVERFRGAGTAEQDATALTPDELTQPAELSDTANLSMANAFTTIPTSAEPDTQDTPDAPTNDTLANTGDTHVPQPPEFDAALDEAEAQPDTDSPDVFTSTDAQTAEGPATPTTRHGDGND